MYIAIAQKRRIYICVFSKIANLCQEVRWRNQSALCSAKDVSEPRGEERYCHSCWEKKIAIEEIVAREFALKRYIRAHSAEKYLIYHSTIKRPCGQIIVVDDGYDLFLTMFYIQILSGINLRTISKGTPKDELLEKSS